MESRAQLDALNRFGRPRGKRGNWIDRMACPVARWPLGDRLGARPQIFGWPDPTVAEPGHADRYCAELCAARTSPEVGVLWNRLCRVDGHWRRRNRYHRHAGIRRTGVRVARDLS